jgi:hypothetical protein
MLRKKVETTPVYNTLGASNGAGSEIPPNRVPPAGRITFPSLSRETTETFFGQRSYQNENVLKPLVSLPQAALDRPTRG